MTVLILQYIRDKFGKCFGFQENSPYRVLIKERQVKEKKPKVQGETLQIKIRDIISNVINEIGNPVSFAQYYYTIVMLGGGAWWHEVGLTQC